jgi:PAS domain S-box-containing protein
VGAQVKPVRRVLILNELGPASPAIALVDGQIRAGLEHAPYQIELYIESLETTLFPDSATQKEFRDWYLHKYRDRKPDVIIAVGPSPIRFLAESHEKFFPDTPVVFCISTEQWAGYPNLDSHFTGVWEQVDMAKVMDVVLKLKPQTKHVVVVGGVAAYDRANEVAIKNGLRDYLSRIDVTYLTDLDMPSLLERIKQLPKDTIILHAGVSEDAAGTHYLVASQSTPLIIKAANAPVFAMGDMEMGQGDVGGYMMSFPKEGEIVAADVLRILNGEKPQDIPIVRGANIYMFDWRALKRWGLNEENLPAGSIVLNRQPSFWQLYRLYIIGGFFLLLAQTLLILGLLLQRTRLLAAQERFRSVFEYSAVGMALVSNDGRWTQVNRALCELLGYSEQELLATDFQSLTHPDDLDADLSYARKVFAGEIRLYHMEKRYIHKQGHVVWVTLTASAVPDASGKVSYGIAQVQDITVRKNIEATLRREQEELHSLAGRLITVQEEERKRIARDLHDDLSQRLALLCVDLDILRQSLAANADAARDLERMRRETDELVVDMRRLSHNEHHPQWDLGLQHGVASFCQDFSRKHGIAVKVVQEGDLQQIPETVCFTLFRVLQEAMSNVAKHSGADHVTVTLGVQDNRAQLRVTDEGRGFEIGNGRGLGLISMRERLRLVGGTMRVNSSPLQGTDIEAAVPISISRPAVIASR